MDRKRSHITTEVPGISHLSFDPFELSLLFEAWGEGQGRAINGAAMLLRMINLRIGQDAFDPSAWPKAKRPALNRDRPGSDRSALAVREVPFYIPSRLGHHLIVA
jgi:hypothetical protein